MKRPTIKAGGQWFELDKLEKKSSDPYLNDFERKVIRFALDWQRDKQSFEFNTSGSTGVPKKIVFTRNQLIASAKLTINALSLQQGETSLICLDTDFIAGAMMVVRSLVEGMNMIVVRPSSDPMETVTDKIDFAAFVPLQITTMLEQSPKKLAGIRVVIIGGAPLTQTAIDSLQSFPGIFYATYGMTETVTHVALQKLNGPDRHDYFQLLSGISASLDNRECLVLKPTHLGDETIITNDIVQLIDADKFLWKGRYDQVINSGGLKIYPEKIERALETIFKIINLTRRFFIAGIQNDKFGEQLTLFIEGPPLTKEIEEEIKHRLSSFVGKHEIPKTFLYTSRFEETSTQKIDRKRTIRNIASK